MAHAMTPMGHVGVETEAERLIRARNKHVDGGWTAQWLRMCAYEADEVTTRSAGVRGV